MLQPKRVFISYASDDREWAEETARILRGQRVDVFLDVDTIRAGDHWPDVLRAEVDRADQVRLGWSKDAGSSDWVRKEYTAALKKPPGSLLIDLLDRTPLPAELAHVQAEPSRFRPDSLVDRVCRPFAMRLPPTPSPSYLLRYEYGVVPFHGREREIASAMDWVDQDSSFAARLVTGVGGSGKTRFAAQLCGELQRRGWDASFLDADSFATEIGATPGAAEELLKARRRPSFLVVDQAETWARRPLEQLISTGTRKSSGRSVRLMLLARSRGDWWDELLVRRFDVRAALADGGITASTLEPLEVTPDFDEARRAFADALRKTVVPMAAPDLARDEFGRILIVHVAALLTVIGDWRPDRDAAQPMDGPPGERAHHALSNLLRELLMHEESHWRQEGERNEDFDAATRSSAALMTLLGGCRAAPAAVREIMVCSRYFSALSPAMQDRVARVFIEQYGHSGHIEPLRPDLLGEQLIEEVLRNEPTLCTAWVRTATRDQITYALTVLDRIAERWPQARAWYDAVLSEPEALQATQEGMREMLDRIGESPELLPGLAKTLKFRFDALRIHNRPKEMIAEAEAAEQSLRSVVNQRHDVQNELNMLADIKAAASIQDHSFMKDAGAPSPASAVDRPEDETIELIPIATTRSDDDRIPLRQRWPDRKMAAIIRSGRASPAAEVRLPPMTHLIESREGRQVDDVPRGFENDLKDMDDALDVMRWALERDQTRAKAAGLHRGPAGP
ncbi:MAG: TIR domain-containing protein [Gemmatimonadetes bacterium]|nr:TIR domain-containing protein [Gemmatimonadota bacterium]